MLNLKDRNKFKVASIIFNRFIATEKNRKN